MSPSESDLRAALHEGEGEQLDVGTLITHAHAVRRRRQRRIYAAVGAAAAVIVIGGGVAAITGRSSGSAPAADHSLATPGKEAAPHQDGAPAPAPGGANTPRSAPESAQSSASSTVTAPNPAPNPAPDQATGSTGTSQPAACGSAPGPAAPPRSGGETSLFGGTVASIRVCAYPLPGARLRSELLRGTQATALVRALTQAPAAAPPTCAGPPAGTLVLHAADAQGRDLGSVEFKLACDVAEPMNRPALHSVRIADLPASVRALLQ